ncbi:MAG TPA: hypothetical protein VHL11_19605 [Phototrophicaceae bacterium]|jgi:hypothetical protein|nr:hypothetical protein [Phototrophicaceae bacterium]
MTPSPSGILYPELTALAKNVGYAWLENPSLVVVQLESSSREAIDAWIKFSADIRRGWDASRPLLILVDVSKGSFSPTPHATSELKKLVLIRPEIKTCSAIVLSRSFVSHLIETLVRVTQRSGDSSQNRIFYNREDAALWLKQMAVQLKDQ